MSDGSARVGAPSSRQQRVIRYGLWAGAVGPVFFVVVFSLDGLLTPGYDAMREVISFLELSPNGWIQRLNFILTGGSFILFGIAFYIWIRRRSGSAWRAITTAWIALSGIGLIMAGLFLPDPPGTTALTVQGSLHAIAFTVIFLALGLACLFVGAKFIVTRGSRIFGGYSLVAGIWPIFAALGSFYSSFVAANASSTAFTASSSQLAIGGLLNRIFVVVAFAWYVVLAIRLLKQSGGARNVPTSLPRPEKQRAQ